MKKSFRFLVMLILFLLLSSMVFGEGTAISVAKAGKLFDKKSEGMGFIFGKLTMIHTVSEDLIRDEDGKALTDTNRSCRVMVKLVLVNTDTQKEYQIDFLPVLGSSNCYYKKKIIDNNQDNQIFLMQLPIGNYELLKIESKYIFQKDGYHRGDFAMFEKMVVTYSKKRIKFTIKENQLMYIGDHLANLQTYFGMNLAIIRWWYDYNFIFSDCFETTKDELMLKVSEKVKEKLNSLEFGSALNQ